MASLLKKVFGGRTRKSCLAVQVVIHEYALPNFRQDLHRLIEEGAAKEGSEHTVWDRQAALRRIVGLVEQATPFFEYGSWEYNDREKEAQSTFQEWVGELQAGMAAMDTERGDDVDGLNRLEVEQSYVALSIILLFNGPVKEAEKWDADDRAFWTRDAFANMLRTLSTTDFSYLEGDALFLMPGTNEDGLSEMDLADEGWEHLELLT